ASAFGVYGSFIFCRAYAMHAATTLHVALHDCRHLLNHLVQPLIQCAVVYLQGHLGRGMSLQCLCLRNGGSCVDHQIDIRWAYSVKIEIALDSVYQRCCHTYHWDWSAASGARTLPRRL